MNNNESVEAEAIVTMQNLIATEHRRDFWGNKIKALSHNPLVPRTSYERDTHKAVNGTSHAEKIPELPDNLPEA